MPSGHIAGQRAYPVLSSTEPDSSALVCKPRVEGSSPFVSTKDTQEPCREDRRGFFGVSDDSYSRLYFSRRPFAFSTGYFRSFSASLSSMAFAGSIPASWARSRQ